MKNSFSKYLSYILRHKPDSIGLELDKNGWANLDDLIDKTTEFDLSKEIIQEIVDTNNKKRFEIKDNKIRASQGHSIDIDLGLTPTQPPNILYHGTAVRFMDSILQKGIISKDRDYVHLSDNEQTAMTVGMRHGKPSLIKIDSKKMHEAGYKFFLSKNGVWLTKYIPVIYMHTKKD